jgi:hypothetical protein
MAVGFNRIWNMHSDIVIIFVVLHFVLLPYICRDMPYSKYYQVRLSRVYVDTVIIRVCVDIVIIFIVLHFILSYTHTELRIVLTVKQKSRTFTMKLIHGGSSCMLAFSMISLIFSDPGKYKTSLNLYSIFKIFKRSKKLTVYFV